MASVPLTLAILVLLSITVAFVMAELASDLKRKSRYLKHDLNGSLSVLMMELDRIAEGRSTDAVAAKQLTSTIKAVLHPEGEQQVNLRQYLKLVTSSYRSREIEYYDSAKPFVKVDVAELHRIMVNALQNALEARIVSGSRQPIRIHLEESCIKISNLATEEDRNQILQQSGSTRGEGRGHGRMSIKESCNKIDWEPTWETTDTRVILTLSFCLTG